MARMKPHVRHRKRRIEPRYWGLLLLPLLLLLHGRSEAAIPVQEVGLNLIQNTIQAVQSVAAVANQAIELTPIETMVGAHGLKHDLDALTQLVEEGTGLAWDIGVLNAQIEHYLGYGELPHRSYVYRVRQGQYHRLVVESYSYAMRTQTLITSAVRIVDRVWALITQVNSMVGNLQISQNAAQAPHQLAQLLLQANTQSAAFERAEAMKRANEEYSQDAAYAISMMALRSHPRWP